MRTEQLSRRVPRRQALALAIGIGLALGSVLVQVARADEPVRGNILVPVDHVDPGGSIPISGYGLDRGATISMTLTHATETVDLGQGTVAADGSLSASATLPATFPLGYAELAATSSEGGRWVVSVLVGSIAPAATSAAAGSWSNLLTSPNVLPLAVVAVGLVIFLAAGWRFLRR